MVNKLDVMLCPPGHVITCTAIVIFASCVVVNSKECGQNPMRRVLLVAKRTGRSLDYVLTVLQDIDSPAYELLAKRFRMYAACVGLVDTGYFRKRTSHTASTLQEVLPAEHAYTLGKKLYSSEPLRTQKRLSLTSSWSEPISFDYIDDQPLEQSFLEPVARVSTSGGQRLADADDINRSLKSLFIKAQKIIEADRHARQQQVTSMTEREQFAVIPDALDDIDITLRSLFE